MGYVDGFTGVMQRSVREDCKVANKFSKHERLSVSLRLFYVNAIVGKRNKHV